MLWTNGEISQPFLETKRTGYTMCNERHKTCGRIQRHVQRLNRKPQVLIVCIFKFMKETEVCHIIQFQSYMHADLKNIE